MVPQHGTLSLYIELQGSFVKLESDFPRYDLQDDFFKKALKLSWLRLLIYV